MEHFAKKCNEFKLNIFKILSLNSFITHFKSER